MRRAFTKGVLPEALLRNLPGPACPDRQNKEIADETQA
jgi:hypothetical protein